jgi:xanthine dehydrogenase accessory factor
VRPGLLKQAAFWDWVQARLKQNEAVVVLWVVDHQGSSPGKRGAKMALTESGARFGTVGGGAIEWQLLQMAETVLKKNHSQPVLIKKQHRVQNSEYPSGMMCGGEQSTVIYYCQQTDIELIQSAKNALNHATVWHLSLQGLVLETSDLTGWNQGENWHYRESITSDIQVYIVGAGHVAYALSRILATLEYEIILLDERKTETFFRDNPYASRKVILNYHAIASAIPEGDSVFVLVMTHSHRLDQLVLRQLAGRCYAYLGVIGSQTKIQHIRQALLSELPDEAVERIQGPVGLDIGSHTPEEIAISIAAQMIQMQNT